MTADKSILITGASGLLGANLTMELVALGKRVIPVYQNNPIVVEGADSIACNMTNPSEIEDLLSKSAPSLVIHCAAAANVDWCESHPQEAMIINAHSAGELAAQANNVGARFIYISTDSVFDGISGGYAETDVARPQNSYARSKLAGEEAVLRATRRALVLRVNFFAWNMQRKDSLAEWILSRLKRGEAVPGFSDTTFSPVLANDISGWILRLVDLDFNGILHMGSADHCSKYEFAREIAKVFQFDDSLIRRTLMEESTLLAPRPRNTWLRTERLAQLLGHPLPSIREGLEKFRTLRDNGFYQQLKLAGSRTDRNGAECLH